MTAIPRRLSCPICWTEDLPPERQMKWHAPLTLEQRTHLACIDCMATLCHKALNRPSQVPNVPCPECQNIIVIQLPKPSFYADAPHFIWVAFKLSVPFFLSKILIEPMVFEYTDPHSYIPYSLPTLSMIYSLAVSTLQFCGADLNDMAAFHHKLLTPFLIAPHYLTNLIAQPLNRWIGPPINAQKSMLSLSLTWGFYLPLACCLLNKEDKPFLKDAYVFFLSTTHLLLGRYIDAHLDPKIYPLPQGIFSPINARVMYLGLAIILINYVKKYPMSQKFVDISNFAHIKTALLNRTITFEPTKLYA